jgi:DNA-binding response OmpR family regulator
MAPHVSVPVERSARVLLVDSDPLALRVLRQRVRALHPKWMVFAVERASHALELVRRGGIDVVVTELELSDSSGAELLRSASDSRDAPICIVHTVDPDRARALGAMAHRVLAKPADDAVLFPAMVSALRLKREARRSGHMRRSA